MEDNSGMCLEHSFVSYDRRDTKYSIIYSRRGLNGPLCMMQMCLSGCFLFIEFVGNSVGDTEFWIGPSRGFCTQEKTEKWSHMHLLSWSVFEADIPVLECVPWTALSLLQFVWLSPVHSRNTTFEITGQCSLCQLSMARLWHSGFHCFI
jgi:hypothetical protein